MAAPVQSVNYYYGQKTRQEGLSPPCKDLTVVENGGNSRDGINCDEVSKQSTANSAGNTMDRAFQDGAAAEQANSARYPHNIGESRLNNDMNRYYSNTSDPNLAPDEYGKIGEPANQGQMSGYVGQGGMYRQGGYSTGDQHGGSGPPDTAISAQNHMYSSYNQSPMRPVYSQNSKAMHMNRPPVSCQNVGMGPQPNYSSNQRFMGSGGHGISQQGGGPTPTLNQLLQSPNPVHRYQNNYGDYSVSPNVKTNQDLNSGNQYAQHWSGSRSMPGSPYPQQVASPYRNQVCINAASNPGWNSLPHTNDF